MDLWTLWNGVLIGVTVTFIIYQHVLLTKRTETVNNLTYAMRGILNGEVEVYRDEVGQMCFKHIEQENNNGDS